MFLSCATTVKFRAEHPPLVDLRGIYNITVIPLEWRDNGRYRYLAGDVTRALGSGVKKAKIYKFVNPSKLKNLSPVNYSDHVDVYITGEIRGVYSYDRNDIRVKNDSDDESKKEITLYTTRTVVVEIEYKYVRAANSEVLKTFRKRETSSTTFRVTGKEKRGNNTSVIARGLVKNFSNTMSRELNPWTTAEKRRIERDKNGDVRLTEAEKLVRKKKYSEAFDMYRGVYNETGNVAAGYNAALLLEADQKYEEALLLLENVSTRVLQSSFVRPDYIRDEINRLKKLLSDYAELSYYRERLAALL